MNSSADRSPHLDKAAASIRFDMGKSGSLGLEDAAAAIRKADGVALVEANHLSNTIYVEYDPRRITLEAIRKIAQPADLS